MLIICLLPNSTPIGYSNSATNFPIFVALKMFVQQWDTCYTRDQNYRVVKVSSIVSHDLSTAALTTLYSDLTTPLYSDWHSACKKSTVNVSTLHNIPTIPVLLLK